MQNLLYDMFNVAAVIHLDSHMDCKCSHIIKVNKVTILIFPTSEMLHYIYISVSYLQYLSDFKEYEARGDISTCYQTYGKMLVGVEEKYKDLMTSCVIVEEYVTSTRISEIEFCIQNGKIRILPLVI